MKHLLWRNIGIFNRAAEGLRIKIVDTHSDIGNFRSWARGSATLPARVAVKGECGRNKLRPSRLGERDGGYGAGGEGECAVGAAELACDAKFLAGGVDDTGEAAAVARAPKRAHRRR